MLQTRENIVFHFNKGHLADATIPMWVIKIHGETLYIDHVDFENCSFSTKETPDNPHTKGSIKIKNCNLQIEEIDGKRFAKVSQSK